MAHVLTTLNEGLLESGEGFLSRRSRIRMLTQGVEHYREVLTDHY